MFKEIQSALTKFFSKEFVLVVIIFIVLVWGLLSYSGDKLPLSVYEGVEDGSDPVKQTDNVIVPPVVQAQSGYALQPVANPSDLLPADGNSKWAELNPSAIKGGDVMMPDLLQAGYHIGLDTIGQSLRNANLQLRSDPIIAKADIGPWNQSTIEADTGRVPLELGR